MPRSGITTLALTALVALALGLAGCEDGTSPDVDAEFSERLNGSVGLYGVTQHQLAVPRSGTMTLALTWPGPDVNLRLHLTDSECTGYPPTDCEVLESEPEEDGGDVVIRRSIVEGEVYKVWIDNSESGIGSTYTLDLRIR